MKERNMILANIGSGSSYLPDIAEMLIERRDKMQVEEWRLMDIDEYRLNCTGKYVQKMFEDANMPTKIVLTNNLEEAVQNCDFVICTAVRIIRHQIKHSSICHAHPSDVPPKCSKIKIYFLTARKSFK